VLSRWKVWYCNPCFHQRATTRPEISEQTITYDTKKPYNMNAVECLARDNRLSAESKVAHTRIKGRRREGVRRRGDERYPRGRHCLVRRNVGKLSKNQAIDECQAGRIYLSSSMCGLKRQEHNRCEQHGGPINSMLILALYLVELILLIKPLGPQESLGT
jgi:hypothetical protein